MGEKFKSIREATHEIPVSREFDVIVAGGGTAGIGAATAAAGQAPRRSFSSGMGI